jgi:hypothetical protein
MLLPKPKGVNIRKIEYISKRNTSDNIIKTREQAGAGLCQAQDKLGHLCLVKNVVCLPVFQILMSSSIFQNIDDALHFIGQQIGVVFHFQHIEAIFHLPKYRGLLPFAKILRLSSICQNIEVVFNLQKTEVVFHLEKKLSLSSIFKNI